MKQRFDVTNLDSLERDFAKAKLEVSEWEWIHGYLPLYLSQKNRLLREKEKRELEQNKRTKK